MHAGVNPVFQLLVYPATDMRMGQQSHKDNAEGYLLTADSMRWFIGHYLQGDEKKKHDPMYSPLLSDDALLKKSPPTLVITAEFDPLRDEGEEFARRLAAVGVQTSTVRFNGQIHAFFGMSEVLDDAAAAIALSASYLRKHLSV
jgi:acetyl esterase